jgi:hypothetical protein
LKAIRLDSIDLPVPAIGSADKGGRIRKYHIIIFGNHRLALTAKLTGQAVTGPCHVNSMIAVTFRTDASDYLFFFAFHIFIYTPFSLNYLLVLSDNANEVMSKIYKMFTLKI